MRPSTQTPPLVVRDRRLAELAKRQHGVVSYRQLRSIGFSVWALKAGIARGRLLSLHGEVYAVGHARLDQSGRRWAGVLAYGSGAVLSHRSAAALWGLARERRGVVEVTAPAGRQGPERRRRLWIHRCKLGTEDRTEQGGLPVTTVARTLFDFAEVESFSRLEQAWEEADRLKLLRYRRSSRFASGDTDGER
jgi:predicted transcriptional regulator of viral defense system